MEEGGKEQCVDIKCGQKRRVHMAIFAFSKQTFFPSFCCTDNPLLVAFSMVKSMRTKLKSEYVRTKIIFSGLF